MAKRKKNAAADGAAPQALRIEGEMTIYTAAELKGRIVAALDTGAALALDLSAVGEIDSAGLQLLLLAQREGERRGQSVSLSGHSTAVLECLNLCNMAALLGAPDAVAAGSQP